MEQVFSSGATEIATTVLKYLGYAIAAGLTVLVAVLGAASAWAHFRRFIGGGADASGGDSGPEPDLIIYDGQDGEIRVIGGSAAALENYTYTRESETEWWDPGMSDEMFGDSDGPGYYYDDWR